jgi:hypothetical protein
MLAPLRQPPRWLTHSKEDQHEGNAKKISTGSLSAEKGVELRARRWPEQCGASVFYGKKFILLN